MKQLIKRFVPAGILKWRRKVLLQKELTRHDEDFAGKPAKEIFSKVYAQKMWGGGL